MSNSINIILSRIDSFETSMFKRMDAAAARITDLDARIDLLEHGSIRAEARAETNKTLRKRGYEFALVLMSGAISAFAAYSAASYNPPTPPLETLLPPKSSQSTFIPYAPSLDPKED